MKKIAFSLLFLLITSTCHSNNQPRLVLQIVIDQLRGDLITQHQHQFGNNGFNYLLKHGLDYHNAHHPHANTTTCAGHATIATGSYPTLHGVVNNDWYDRNTKQLTYCMEDLKAEILPTSRTHLAVPGRSPRNLMASTLSDEVILAKKGKAFGVALKDRAAITLAGHAGKAFWFDKANGGFITSNYYYSSYPLWVQQWNKGYQPAAFEWTLSRPIADYQNKDNPRPDHDYKQFGQNFPHHIANPPSADYFNFQACTPKSDQLTADFAIRLMTEEKLGTTADKTDYLAISLSAVDVIGHQFGPNSLEAEDNLLMLDQTLANLFSAIDKQIGLDNALIILTADHGVDDSPPYLMANHIAEVQPVNIKDTEIFIRKQLKDYYQLPPETLMSITLPYVYLDHQIINDHKLNLSDVSQYLAQRLTLQPGIFKAYPLPVTNAKDWLSTKVDRMAYPERSGDVYLVPPPYQSLSKSDDATVTHGSPWLYDSYVPLLFVNPQFKAQVISRPVRTTDIAATLAALLMIKPPSATVGQPLTEVLTGFNKN